VVLSVWRSLTASVVTLGLCFSESATSWLSLSPFVFISIPWN
jgi:hypothetical protein